MVPILMFLSGLLILLISSDKLIDSAKHIAETMRISPIVIGSTILAFGTSLPELTVSITAVLSGDAGLALGNVVGSNIINILLIASLGIIIGKIEVNDQSTHQQIAILAFVTILFVIFNMFWVPIWGFVLLTLALLFTWFILIPSSQQPRRRFPLLKPHVHSLDVVLAIASITGICVGGVLTVRGAEMLTTLTGLSTTVIGLLLVSLSTSLPELLVTILSAIRKENTMALGNILGSNIYNILCIGGISLLVEPPELGVTNWLFFLFSAMMLFFTMSWYKNSFIPKWIGGISLLIFIIFNITNSLL